MARVLIVATTSYAGMGPYVSEIVNNFTADDDVYYFFCDYEDSFFKKNVKRELLEKSFIFKTRISKKNKIYELLFNRFHYEKSFLNYCEQSEVDSVHFINGCPSENLQKRLHAKGIKILGTVHDLHPHEAKKAFHKMLRFKINAVRSQKTIKYCPNLVTNSKAQYEELKRLYPQKFVAYHAFPSLVTNSVRIGKDCPSEIMNLQRPYILFFGRIEEYKGVALLYRAFLECEYLRENYNLVIAGIGSCYCESCVPEKNVVWINRYIKDSEVACLYKNASCVVYPYISATQSGVLSLAYFFNTPILASNIPFFKYALLQSGTGLLFERNNVADLSRKLSQLLKTDHQLMIQNQNRYYQLEYEGSSIRNELLSIYSKLR